MIRQVGTRRTEKKYHMDVDLEHVASQMGTAIIDLSSGNIIRATGDLSDQRGKLQCEKLHKLMMVSTFQC